MLSQTLSREARRFFEGSSTGQNAEFSRAERGAIFGGQRPHSHGPEPGAAAEKKRREVHTLSSAPELFPSPSLCFPTGQNPEQKKKKQQYTNFSPRAVSQSLTLNARITPLLQSISRLGPLSALTPQPPINLQYAV